RPHRPAATVRPLPAPVHRRRAEGARGPGRVGGRRRAPVLPHRLGRTPPGPALQPRPQPRPFPQSRAGPGRAVTVAARTLYLVRLGVPLDAVWQSPLPRAAASASVLAGELGAQPPRVLVDAAPELVDHVPHVPTPEELSPSWVGFL